MKEDKYQRSQKLKEKSELLFRKECDENNYVYLYIDQEKITFSSRLWQNLSKRPDYLLTLPHIGSFFVDVKAYTERVFYEKDYEKTGKSPPPSFGFDFLELMKYVVLQNETSLKVWFAVMPVHDETVMREINFIPLDKIYRFILPQHRSKIWPYVQIPKHCFNDCKRIAFNKCNGCVPKYCEEIRKMLSEDIGPRKGAIEKK